MITLLKPLTPLFLQRDFIISSTFDLVTRQGGEKSVQALSVAGRLAGTLAGAGLRSAAASCSLPRPRHYVHKWISEWSRSSADMIVATAKQYSVDVGAQQRKRKSG